MNKSCALGWLVLCSALVMCGAATMKLAISKSFSKIMPLYAVVEGIISANAGFRIYMPALSTFIPKTQLHCIKIIKK